MHLKRFLLVVGFTLIATMYVSLINQGVSPAPVVALVIIATAALLWVTEAVALFAVSLLILFLSQFWLRPILTQEGIEVSAELFFQPFFSNIIVLFLGSFTLSHYLYRTGLDQKLARLALARTQGNPKKVLWTIIALGAGMSMWMSNTATAAMMMTMIMPVIASLPKGHPCSKALILAVPFSCNLGGLGTPVGSPPNAIAIAYLEQMGVQLSFLHWMAATVPLMLILLLALGHILLKFYDIGDTAIAVPASTGTPLNKHHYAALTLFIVTACGWLTTGWHGYSSGTIALIPVAFCFTTGLLSRDDFTRLPWDILFMVGGGLLLGLILQTSGLDLLLARQVSSTAGYWQIFLFATLLATLMTTFMSNTAAANLLIPVAVGLTTLPSEAIPISLAIAVMCSCAMALPISTPPNAIAYGSGLVSSEELRKPGIIVTSIAMLLTVALFQFYWFLL